MNLRNLRALFSILLAIALLAACASSGEGETTSTAAPTTSVPEATTSTEAPTTTVPPTTTTTLPAPPPFEATVVAAGDQHVCAIAVDSFTYCWGYNEQGQLGNGTNETRTVPTLVSTDQTFTSLTAGRYFTCALNAEGAAYCWGDNSSGALGNGVSGGGSADADQSTPVPVSTDLRFTALAAGQVHVCGVTADAETYCWGAGSSGQLGSGETGTQTTPVRAAEGIQVVALTPGSDSNMCALDTDGAAWCWGSNAFGQLGTGDKYNNSQPVPQAVSGGLVFTQLTHGRTFACGLLGDGTISCWGDNRDGQLGDGTTDERLVPTLVDTDITFASVFAGTAHTCGLDATSAAYCWGSNGFGQLGDGTEGGGVVSPAPVSGVLTFISLSPGEEYTCGITTDSAVYCWGSNRDGWLGDGTQDARFEPTPVAPPLAG